MPPKIIAFYLPQFHRIPENDAWWGEGYTEWVDVRRAVPRFDGHLQPRLPTTLGFYDLTDAAVQERQAQMATEHGVFGFCYYYYWFGGKRLLLDPLENMRANPGIQLPFCICFANETWTRIWQGRKDEVLIRQEHNDLDDRAFFRSLVPYMNDSRYIRIGSKPLLLVYRTELFSNGKRTADIWRDEAQRNGIGEIYLCRCESYFDFTEPSAAGFDASYDFPPHSRKMKSRLVQRRNGFDGGVFDFASAMPDSFASPGYKRFHGVMTGFDNSPKAHTGSWVFVDSDPALYLKWLTGALRDTVERQAPEEQLVFVNAWNEWGEGAILEPCSRFGDSYLKATAAAMNLFSRAGAAPAGPER